jgi:hypothetical protein
MAFVGGVPVALVAHGHRMAAAAATDDALTQGGALPGWPGPGDGAGRADDRGRVSKAAELAVERARYDADRAERAFTAAEPENRLVTRTLESRWEVKTDRPGRRRGRGDRHPARRAAAAPARADLESLIGNLPALFDADSTTPRDRKRLLRTPHRRRHPAPGNRPANRPDRDQLAQTSSPTTSSASPAPRRGITR